MKVSPTNPIAQEERFSFLPEDYLERKAEHRTNIVSVTLFSIVLFAIVAAFFVTNRQWTTVKSQQEAINLRYMQAARQIDELRKLETQKREMISKALVTTALLEKAPRSVLLADLINRMPERLALLEFNLKSKRVKQPAKAAAAAAQASRAPGRPQSLAVAAANTAQGALNAQPAPSVPEAPRYESLIDLVGVAPSHNQVAAYVASLQQSPLLQHVELKYSESTIVDDVEMTQFRIQARMRPDADARRIAPIDAPTRNGFFAPDGAQAGVNEGADEQDR